MWTFPTTTVWDHIFFPYSRDHYGMRMPTLLRHYSTNITPPVSQAVLTGFPSRNSLPPSTTFLPGIAVESYSMPLKKNTKTKIKLGGGSTAL